MEKIKVNEQTFERAFNYNRFKNMEMAGVCVTGKIDVTKAYKLSKKGHKFNAIMCFAVMHAAQNVKEFHYQIEEDGLYFYKNMQTNYVVKGRDGNLYFPDVKWCEKLSEFEEEYIKVGKFCIENNQHYIINQGAKISTSAVVNYPFQSISLGLLPDFIDNFCMWGAYEKHLTKTYLNVSLRFHHALMDGEHAGLFLKNLQEIMKNIEKYM